MAKANDIAARAAKLNATPRNKTASTSAQAPTEPAKASTAAPRVKPMRLTLDLAPNQYRDFNAVCRVIAEEIGEARIPGTQVLRALVAQLSDDPALRATVAELVREQRK